jgi:SagB-type dehydrogenase family enzyme
MSVGDSLITSPMLFAHRGRGGRLVAGDPRQGVRFRLASARAAEIAIRFLDPCSVSEAIEDGFELADLEEARAAGILVPADKLETLGTWERHGWSRPAHLLFSQMDVSYIESDEAMSSRPAITAERRSAVAAYMDEQDPPRPRQLATGEIVELPPPPPSSPTLSSLTERRSARAFAASPPAAEQLAGTLHTATAGLRAAAADRAANDDPLHRLNSFGSWAHLFVVVQDVEGVSRGSFEYDIAEHRLVRAGGPVADDDLLAAVNRQPWILGPGFVVFVVAQLRPYAWLYRYSRAYVQLLIHVGDLGQGMLMAATDLGLAGWLSPAVHESRAAALLNLPDADDVEVVSMIKLGRPAAARARPLDR